MRQHVEINDWVEDMVVNILARLSTSMISKD